MEYRVELDVYNGPLDLLLYLIKRDELDIYDIPIARITESYMEYVEDAPGDERGRWAGHQRRRRFPGDGGHADGDQVGAAAAPADRVDRPRMRRRRAEDLTDPRYELVQKLLEYKRFKDSAMLLEQQGDRPLTALSTVSRRARPDSARDEPPPLDMEEVQIWDLLEAFNRLMREVGLRKTFHEVVYDDTPIDLHAADIEDRLTREGKLTLRQLIMERKSKSEMIGVFLALLELTRQKKILVAQSRGGGRHRDPSGLRGAPQDLRET